MSHDQLHHFHLRTFENRFTGAHASERIRMQRLEMLYQHVESRLARKTEEQRAAAPRMLSDEAERLAAIEMPYIAESYLAIGGRRWPLTWAHREAVQRVGQLDLLTAPAA